MPTSSWRMMRILANLMILYFVCFGKIGFYKAAKIRPRRESRKRTKYWSKRESFQLLCK